MRLIKLLPAVALVQSVLSTGLSYTEEICITIFASTQPKKVVSTTQFEVIEFLALHKFTSTPSTTITAKASIVTSTQTQTVTSTSIDSVVTDTYSSTSTVFNTAIISTTVIATVVETNTITTTETPPTFTVPTPAGFTPINPPSVAIKKEKAPKKRNGSRKSPPGPANNLNAVKLSFSNGKLECSPPQYPSKVECDELIEIISTTSIIYTARETITKHTSAPAVTQIIEQTYTTTTTSLPTDASTTLTFFATSSLTSTSTISSTTTTTETFTITVTAPTPTIYAACAADNIITDTDDGAISSVFYIYGSNSVVPDISSAYDCCALCQQQSDCEGSVLVGQTCNLGVSTDCEANLEAGAYAGTYYSSSSPGAAVYVSNGPCGQLDYGGVYAP